MNCRIEELCNKDVINISSGNRIGYVADVEVDTCSGQICNLLIAKTDRGSIFKKPDYIRISWNDIEVLGNETILIRYCNECNDSSSHRRFFDIFSK
ncbi:MAG: YlmC/YmxH family sporulation protein [Ruminococcaceae bacterium]|nr:YlmC/YmxH family sporulation protein [Oscillospiraceae bacterium]MBR3595763.1 YlmC/YmxH family sporulation protein [Clostridia bacterium]